MSLISIDMNKDGHKDILISDRRGPKRGIFWLEYPGPEAAIEPSQWKRHEIGGNDREIKFISQGDLDKDGRLDVIAIDTTSIIWFRFTESEWEEHVIPLPDGVGGGKSAGEFRRESRWPKRSRLQLRKRQGTLIRNQMAFL